MTDHVPDVPSPSAAQQPLAEENARLRAELDAVHRQRWLRARSIASICLAALAAITVVAATTGYWLRSTAFDTDAVVGVVRPSLASEPVAAWASAYVSDQAIAALDVEARLQTRLGELDTYLRTQLVEALDPGPVVLAAVERLDVPKLADFAAPLSNAVNQRIRARVDEFVRAPEVQQLLTDAVARGHAAAVALITDDTAALPNVDVVDGEVRLSLVPLVTSAVRDAVQSETALSDVNVLSDVADSRVGGVAIAQLQQALGTRLPDDFGQVTIMTASDLAELQSTAARLNRLVWLSVLLAIVLIVVAVAVSPNRRRTLVQLGIGTAFALLVASIAVGNISEVIQRAVTEPQARAAVTVISEATFSTLATTLLWLAAGAAAVGLVAYAAGKPDQLRDAAESVGRLFSSGDQPGRVYRFAGRHHDALVMVGLAGALIALFLVDIRLGSILLIGGILGLYLWFLTLAKQRTAAPPIDRDAGGMGAAQA